MAAKGYPADPVKNTRIGNLETAAKIENVEIFHAGTYAANGEILSNGGRVLGVCAVGDTLGKACNSAYQAVDLIDWPEGFCRRDIGWRALKEDKAA
jgi:phosphoribosylamine--glycine ligase